MARITTPPSPPLAPPQRSIDFSSLLTFVDVLYGATLGYVFLRIAEGIQPFFHPLGNGTHKPEPASDPIDPIVRLGLEVLVLNYLIHDFAEARLLTHKHGYQGHRRFVIDLFIAALFLVVFVGAEEGSTVLFIPFAMVFLFGAWWAVVLEEEWGKAVLYPYAQATVFTHFGAALACISAWLWWRKPPFASMNTRELGIVWVGYATWVIAVNSLKFALKLPKTDVDLLPVGLIGAVCIKCFRAIVIPIRQLRGWLKRPKHSGTI